MTKDQREACVRLVESRDHWRQLTLDAIEFAGLCGRGSHAAKEYADKIKQLRQRANALDYPECAHQWTDTRNTTSGIQTCMKCGIMRPQ